MVVVVVEVVGHAVFALRCYAKTDLVWSSYSSIADDIMYDIDMEVIPTEGDVLPVGVHVVYDSVQMLPLGD